MDTTAYIALSYQTSLQRKMNNISQNMANMTTTGFKSESMLFESMLQRSGEPRQLAFVQDVGLVRDMSEGPLNQTGNPLDLAISGNAYFAIQTAEGQAYTRAGQFQLDPDGQIVTPGGQFLLDDGGQPITIPPGEGPVEVSADGIVGSANGQIAKLQLASFENEQAMERIGGSLLVTDEIPVPAENVQVLQGHLEGSNVQSIREITRLMDTVRAFEGTQRILEAHHDLARRAVDRMLSNGS